MIHEINLLYVTWNGEVRNPSNKLHSVLTFKKTLNIQQQQQREAPKSPHKGIIFQGLETSERPAFKIATLAQSSIQKLDKYMSTDRTKQILIQHIIFRINFISFF